MRLVFSVSVTNQNDMSVKEVVLITQIAQTKYLKVINL